MKFTRYPSDNPETIKSVITIGNFDGIHSGHQALITKVAALADKSKLNSIVVSMQPLALQYFAGKNNVPILTPFKCKYKLIKNLGVDVFCVLNFNHNLAELGPESFIKNILIDGLNAQFIIVGDDFKFGKNRAGNYQMLKEYCQPLGISVSNIQSIEKNHVRVSSSRIRKALANSQFDVVAEYLGRQFSIAGRVSKGQQLGRQLEFPTINLKLHNKIVPIHGIFAVKVRFNEGQEHIGAASIGTRPTVNGKLNVLEVYILDFDKQVYGQNVEVFFYHKIRNEVKFDSLDELKRHIKEDVIKTRHYFNS